MPLTDQERDNLTRWNGRQKGFYEVYYLKWNDLSQGVAAWIRYTLLVPLKGEPETSIWVIFFDAKDPARNLALKQNFSIREARIERDFFYFAAGPSAIFQSGARGKVASGNTCVSWELKFGEPDLFLRHYPGLLYHIGFPKTKFLAPHLSTRISGDFTVNDHRFALRGVPGHQAHLWGTDMALSWVWGNCNTFAEDQNFCFEGLTARVKVGGRLSPPMTLLFFYWDGKWYKFNSLRHWFTNRSLYDFYRRQRRVEGATRAPIIDRWHFEAGTRETYFVGDLFARPEEMVGLRYENPDGGERFCHNTKIADLKIQVLKKRKWGWEAVKTLTALQSVAFEVVQPMLDPRVRLLVP